MRSIDFSRTEAKSIINISQDYLKNKQNKPRFELLYENSSIHNKKLDLMRAKDYFNKQEKMIPVITKKAQEINRPKDLFFKRLYTYDRVDKDKETKNSIDLNEKEKKSKEKRKNDENNKENGNNNKSDITSSEKNNKYISQKTNYNNDEEDSLYIINDKKKNEEHKKLYKSNNLKNKNIFFLFKPSIDKNSEKIASKIKTKSKDRLLSLSETQKQNLNDILTKREKINEKKIKKEKEKELFKLNNNTYRPYVKNNKRKWVDKLYENGINSIKLKQEKYNNEKMKNENEYLKYSYSPNINRNISYTNIFKSKNYSTNFSNTKNTKSLNINSNRNRSGSSYKSIPKTSIYERNIKWKNIIEEKNKKLKEKLKNNILNESDYNFSPNLNNSIMQTDMSFIKNNMIEYETFLDKYNYSKYKKKLDKVNYRKTNIPPKKIYQKKLVVEFVSECDSKCPTNSGTIKITCDKRPINEIHRNRQKLKINDFFEGNIKLKSNKFFKENNCENDNKYIFLDKNQNMGKERKERLSSYTKKNDNIKNRNDESNLSFFNAINSMINLYEFIFNNY